MFVVVCFVLNLLRNSLTRLRGNFCIEQFSGQPMFAGWVKGWKFHAGTRRLKEFAFRKSSTQTELEQRAGSWQWGINNSLERVEGNRVSGQKVKSVRRLKWQKLPCQRPCHPPFPPHPCRGGTAGAPPDIPRDRSRARGSHPCLPSSLP